MGEVQDQIQRQIDTLVDTGAETGVQVAVYQDGALVVDAVAGTADPLPADRSPQAVDSARLAELSTLAFEGTDQVLGSPARMALGFPIGRIGATAEEHSVAFGWPGGGGSYAYADPARGIAFALTTTRLVPSFDTTLSVTAILADHLAGTR